MIINVFEINPEVSLKWTITHTNDRPVTLRFKKRRFSSSVTYMTDTYLQSWWALIYFHQTYMRFYERHLLVVKSVHSAAVGLWARRPITLWSRRLTLSDLLEMEHELLRARALSAAPFINISFIWPITCWLLWNRH